MEKKFYGPDMPIKTKEECKNKVMTTNEYREQGKHLPDFLKDFHDQKDFFKSMYDVYATELENELPGYTWRSNHIFTIDFFLHFCALHGYGLRKLVAKDVDFIDIEVTKNNYKEKVINSIPGLTPIKTK